MPLAHLLVVDDEPSILTTLQKALSLEGYAVDVAGGVKVAEEKLKKRAYDLCLFDVMLPDGDGVELLERLRATKNDTPVIMMSGHANIDTAVRAVRVGALNFLEKPLNTDALLIAIDTALRLTRAEAEALDLRRAAGRAGELVGESAAIKRLIEQIGRAARSAASVLVTGERGTGKELVARAIHNSGSTADKPFVAVNCTALAPGVLESELFGHVKGAFTGAIGDRPGRFELAGKGTLFLDEIAEIPFELQAKLLRVLQERTFERVGDAKPLPLDARVIAATHRDLAAMVSKGTFREDLYYRLRVVEISLPPLRDRAGDIPVLVEGLLAKITRDLGKDIRYVTPAALARLGARDWPGNIRELENTLTRAVVLAKTDVLDETLLPNPSAAAPTTNHATDDGELPTLREIERRHIVRVLAETEWNKRRACAILDISRPTLDRKIDEYGLRKDEPG
jgi:DNA-binding NtrC family response regulator